MKASYFDAHNDTLTKAIAQVNPVEFLLQGGANINLTQLSSLGARGTCFAAFTDGTLAPPASHTQILTMAAVLQATAHEYPHALALPYSRLQMPKPQAAHLFESTHQHKYPLPLKGVLTLEGAYSFTSDNWEKLLMQYAHLGVKMIAPVWNHSNDCAEGLESRFAKGQSSPRGLTPLGKSVLSSFSSHGILVDVSHMSATSFWDTCHLNCGPLVASHSGAMALKSHPRNLTDDQLKAIATSGGMVNVVFCRTFIGSPQHASSQTVAEHMDYIARLCGVQAVGIGSDYDGATMPVDMPRIENLDRLDQALKRMGYGHSDRLAMLGQNLERLMDVQAKAPYPGKQVVYIDNESVYKDHQLTNSDGYTWLIDQVAALPENHLLTTLVDGNTQSLSAQTVLKLLKEPLTKISHLQPLTQSQKPSLLSVKLDLDLNLDLGPGVKNQWFTSLISCKK